MKVILKGSEYRKLIEQSVRLDKAQHCARDRDAQRVVDGTWPEVEREIAQTVARRLLA